MTEIEGHVYNGFTDRVGGGPVRGAVVSNDWDSTTSTTDGTGYFRLALTKRIAADEFIVLTVKSGSSVVRQPMIGRAHIDSVEILLPSAK